MPPSCGTTTIARSTGGYWQCTFADEFSGITVDTGKWIAQQTANSGYHSGAECFVNSPNNISVAGGTLRLTVRAEAAPFTCTDPYGDYPTQYTSGMVSTFGLFTQAYGRFEVRATLPAATVAGLQEAFWLWPANASKYGSTWPWSGEIDIAEIYSTYPDRAIPYIHYVPAAIDYNVTNNYCMIADIA
ncbi:MAG: glycoside hydrolase family 16 protein, partial [Pseudonocardiales bacterium]